MSGKLNIVLLFIALIAVGVCWLGGDKTSTAATSKIETATVDTGDIKRTAATSGSVRPLITVEVGSHVCGSVVAVTERTREIGLRLATLVGIFFGFYPAKKHPG
jgi:hypothetical protein